MKQKEKKGEWKKDLVEDEATEGMLKEKVDDMIRKLVKMKVKYNLVAPPDPFFRQIWSEPLNSKQFSERSNPRTETSSKPISSESTTGLPFIWSSCSVNSFS